mgnify:CR=1 FL=1
MNITKIAYGKYEVEKNGKKASIEFSRNGRYDSFDGKYYPAWLVRYNGEAVSYINKLHAIQAAEKMLDEVSETLTKGRKILNKVIDFVNEARAKYPEVKDDMLYGDGAVLLYCNANDGTSFDWEMNHSTCEFVIGYKTTKLGFIRAWVRRDGYIAGYLYLDEGRDKAIKLNEEYIGEEDARYFASLLHLEADEKKIWDKPITEINFDREVRNDELLCPVW